MCANIILISGPCRSGKSEYAEETAGILAVRAAAWTGQKPGDLVTYMGTATAGDAEMAARLARHRARRPAAWRTAEVPLWPAPAVREAYAAGRRVLLLDSLGMLVSNRLFELQPPGDSGQMLEGDYLDKIFAPVDDLLAAAGAWDDLSLILVTEETGWGLVPDNALGRLYRDLLGRVNRKVAALADQVWLVVMGLPRRLK